MAVMGDIFNDDIVSHTLGNDNTVNVPFHSRASVSDNLYSDARIVPDFTSWVEILAMSKFGEAMSIDEYLLRADGVTVGNLGQDMAYYSKHLKTMARALSVAEKERLALVAKTKDTLAVFFQSSGKTIYFPVEEAHYIVNDYMTSVDREPLVIRGDRLFSGDDEVSFDEYTQIVENHSSKFNIGSRSIDPQSYLNYAISGLCIWGPFSSVKFMNKTMDKTKWVKMLKAFVGNTQISAGARRSQYVIQHPTQDELVVPEISGLKRVQDKIDVCKQKTYIDDVGTVQTKDFLNVLMSSRSHVATMAGKDKHEEAVLSNLIGSLEAHAAQVAYCDAGADLKFPDLPFMFRFESEDELRGSMSSLTGLRVVVMTDKFQMKEKDRFRLIDNLLGRNIQVIWATRYLDMGIYPSGLLCRAICHTSPFYDYTVIHFSGRLNPGRMSMETRRLVETIVDFEVVRLEDPADPSAPGDAILVLIGTREYRKCVAHSMITTYVDHFEMLVDQNSEAITSGGTLVPPVERHVIQGLDHDSPVPVISSVIKLDKDTSDLSDIFGLDEDEYDAADLEDLF